MDIVDFLRIRKLSLFLEGGLYGLDGSHCRFVVWLTSSVISSGHEATRPKKKSKRQPPGSGSGKTRTADARVPVMRVDLGSRGLA